MLVSPKTECAVKPKMHTEVQIVGEPAKKMLALGEGLLKLLPINTSSVSIEPALRRCDLYRLPAKDIVDLAGQTVKGMSFWHD
ncbi:hypothetical protein AQ436_01000 [Arthrobacter sp. EpRS66]|nr:hypothetical protein AQ436_01000 [Arthrobacter sp. EpRS66]